MWSISSSPLVAISPPVGSVQWTTLTSFLVSSDIPSSLFFSFFLLYAFLLRLDERSVSAFRVWWDAFASFSQFFGLEARVSYLGVRGAVILILFRFSVTWDVRFVDYRCILRLFRFFFDFFLLFRSRLLLVSLSNLLGSSLDNGERFNPTLHVRSCMKRYPIQLIYFDTMSFGQMGHFVRRYAALTYVIVSELPN